MNNFYRGKSGIKFGLRLKLSTTLPKVNNCPIGENSPNLGPMLSFKNHFAEKIGENDIFDSYLVKPNYAKMFSYHWFLRKAPIFSSKIVENGDHKIDSWSPCSWHFFPAAAIMIGQTFAEFCKNFFFSCQRQEKLFWTSLSPPFHERQKGSERKKNGEKISSNFVSSTCNRRQIIIDIY
jgi:hypothetical protein